MQLESHTHRLVHKPTLLPILLLCLVATVPSAAQSQPDSGDETTSAPRDARDVHALLERFDDEPDVRAVQQAVLRHAREGSEPLEHWRRRARWANVVPEIGGDLTWLDQRDSEHRYDEDIETGENGRMRRDSASNRIVADFRVRALYGADVEIDLGGLVFDRDEIAIARESRQRVDTRRTLLAEATDLYFQRRKRQVLALVTPDRQWQRKLELILEVRSLTARIDAMTGGWFRRQLDSASGGHP